jgi:hypothetical protein
MRDLGIITRQIDLPVYEKFSDKIMAPYQNTYQ